MPVILSKVFPVAAALTWALVLSGCTGEEARPLTTLPTSTISPAPTFSSAGTPVPTPAQTTASVPVVPSASSPTSTSLPPADQPATSGPLRLEDLGVPAVGPAFVLTKHGSMTGHPDEVIQGDRSLKGSYSGLSSYHAYLRTDQSVLPLTPEETYRVTFDYRILTTPDRGFETLFYSPIGGGEENWLPSIMIKGREGDTSSKTLTNTLGNYDDYDLRWNVVGTGAIAIDNIRIMNLSTGQDVATEDGKKIEPLFGDSRSDYLYPPALDMPDFSKIALQWQGNGYTAVIGEAGAIPGAFPVLIMSPNTTSGSLTNARPDGSFSSEIVAPPGSWVIVKYDPTPQRQWLGASLLDPRDGDLFDIFTGSAQDAPGAWGYVQFEADSREGTPFSPYSPFGSNK